MTTYAFSQVDVFCDAPPGGNPLAVVHDATGLTDAEMAEFARWTNLSETTFLLPPTERPDGTTADYRVRIFTPGGELPFAGHPTVGSCHAWIEHGGATPEGSVVQECALGEITLRVGDNEIAFAAPELIRSGPVDDADAAEIVASLGLLAEDVLDMAWVDNGPGWVGVLVRDAATVHELTPDFTAMGQHKVGVAGLYADPAAADGADLEVRAFCPGYGAPEDPVTGSLNAGLARWLIATGRLPASYIATQGSALGRRGRIRVDTDDTGVIWVGGIARTLIRGTVDLGV